MSKTKIALAFGSNLGNRQEHIHRAIELLKENGVRNIAVSEFMHSKPVDCPEGSEDFINGALTGIWNGSCRDLLSVCQYIEKQLGRAEIRKVNSARPIDLDILLFEDEIYNEQDLIVPHERMHLRDFVLKPLVELAPDWSIPGLNKNVEAALKEL